MKYIDGVEFLVNPVGSLYEKLYCLPCKIDYEAKDEGYYAAHVSVKIKFEIMGSSFETIIVETPVEIQIMTQLQELIVMLLHKYYETNRREIARDEKWQWNYKSDEFAANYLGHILHYVEGMIVEIRDK